MERGDSCNTLLAQRLADHAVPFSLYPMRCLGRHAYSLRDVGMLTFSALEATACAFRSRAQKMFLVTRMVGHCALERGGVKLFCAGAEKTCSQ